MRLGVGWLTLTFGILCVESILRWNTSTAIWNFLYKLPMTVMLMLSCFSNCGNQWCFVLDYNALQSDSDAFWACCQGQDRHGLGTLQLVRKGGSQREQSNVTTAVAVLHFVLQSWLFSFLICSQLVFLGPVFLIMTTLYIRLTFGVSLPYNQSSKEYKLECLRKVVPNFWSLL